MEKNSMDGLVLVFCKDGIAYPVGLSKKDYFLFQRAIKHIKECKVWMDSPIGSLIEETVELNNVEQE